MSQWLTHSPTWIQEMLAHLKTWEDRALCTPEFRFHITHFNQVSKLGPQQHAFPIYTRKEKKTKTLSNLAESWQQGLKPIEVTDKLGATFFRCSYSKVSLESRLERKWKSEIQLREVHLEHPEDPHHANQPQDLANASHHHRVLHVTIVLRFGANIVQGVPPKKSN